MSDPTPPPAPSAPLAPLSPPPSYIDTPAHLRRDTAYQLLGVTRAAVRQHPYITPQLYAIVRTLRRQRRRLHLRTFFLSYLNASTDPDAQKFMSAYLSLPASWARCLPVEAFCVAASVPPFRLLEVFTATVVRYGAQASAVVAAAMHPSVMEKTIESALGDGESAHADRVVLHKITGSLPQPKGAQTIINLSQSQGQQQGQSQQQAQVAPPPENTIRRFVDRFNDARKLPTAPAHELAAPAADATAEYDPLGDVVVPPRRVPELVPLERRPMPHVIMDVDTEEDEEDEA